MQRYFLVCGRSQLQLLVLLFCQLKKHPTAPHLNPMQHRQAGFLVRESSRAFNQFDHLV